MREKKRDCESYILACCLQHYKKGRQCVSEKQQKAGKDAYENRNQILWRM